MMEHTPVTLFPYSNTSFSYGFAPTSVLYVPADAVRLVAPEKEKFPLDPEGILFANVYVPGLGKIRTRIDDYASSFFGMIDVLEKQGCRLVDMSGFFINPAFIQAVSFSKPLADQTEGKKAVCALHVDSAPSVKIEPRDCKSPFGLQRALRNRPSFVDPEAGEGASMLFFLDQVAGFSLADTKKDGNVLLKITFRDGKALMTSLQEKDIPPRPKDRNEMKARAERWLGKVAADSVAVR